MKKGLSSNVLKICAIIIMVIDHIGFYLYKNFSNDTYFLLRSIRKNGNANICIFNSPRVLLYKKLKKIYSKNVYISNIHTDMFNDTRIY